MHAQESGIHLRAANTPFVPVAMFLSTRVGFAFKWEHWSYVGAGDAQGRAFSISLLFYGGSIYPGRWVWIKSTGFRSFGLGRGKNKSLERGGSILYNHSVAIAHREVKKHMEVIKK